ncbi:hypothetical protein Tco_0553383 [Tanacetum coccineum]
MKKVSLLNEVQMNEATQLTDQEIALDASSDGSFEEPPRDYMLSSGAEDDETQDGAGGSMSHRHGQYTYYWMYFCGTINPNIVTEPSPVIVLDDSCIIERDFSCSLMGKIKDINALSNLYIILANEGFEKVKLFYLIGHWVLLEITSKEMILNHVGVGSWFEVLKPACNSFVCEERLVWVSIEGLHVKALTRNTFTKIISSWGELVDIDEFENCPLSCIREREAWMPDINNEMEDDTYSEEEYEGNNDNDLGSHNEHVSETSFVKENDVEF